VAKRGYVQREMKLALDAWQELPEGTIHTIPVRIDECDLPESFRRYHYANLFVPNGFDRIVRAIRVELTKRGGITPPPSLQSESSTSLSEAPPTADTALEPTFTNSIGMEFVLIPPGTFIMGSPDSDAEAEEDEKPAHRVTISQPFYLGKYPVTQAQWEAVMGNNPSRFKDHPSQPVESVSWNDALAFLRKLNEREGGGDAALTFLDILNEWEVGGNYRLPTEAQWEYACRASTETPRYHPDVNAIAWHERNSNGHPQPVGQKLPNAWGLYDMLGNVWEWCRDGIRTYRAEAPVDPMELIGARAMHVLRGGSWFDSVQRVRSASRSWNRPGYRDGDLGLRCASAGRRR
jgi:formylglycine-generating enzyme required for sulfatase activity